MGIKENIAYRKLRKFKQLNKSASLKPLSQVKTVALLYNVAELKWKQVQQMIKFFEENGKSVTTLGFVNEKELTHEHTPNYKHLFFCKEQLSFWKLPMPNTLSRFITTPFDYMINLDMKEDMVLQAVSTYSQAITRIGLYQEKYQFSQDFMIQAEVNNGTELVEELKKYLVR